MIVVVAAATAMDSWADGRLAASCLDLAIDHRYHRHSRHHLSPPHIAICPQVLLPSCIDRSIYLNVCLSLSLSLLLCLVAIAIAFTVL